jgi:hypothetical protein
VLTASPLFFPPLVQPTGYRPLRRLTWAFRAWSLVPYRSLFNRLFLRISSWILAGRPVVDALWEMPLKSSSTHLSITPSSFTAALRGSLHSRESCKAAKYVRVKLGRLNGFWKDDRHLVSITTCRWSGCGTCSQMHSQNDVLDYDDIRDVEGSILLVMNGGGRVRATIEVGVSVGVVTQERDPGCGQPRIRVRECFALISRVESHSSATLEALVPTRDCLKSTTDKLGGLILSRPVGQIYATISAYHYSAIPIEFYPDFLTLIQVPC